MRSPAPKSGSTSPATPTSSRPWPAWPAHRTARWTWPSCRSGDGAPGWGQATSIPSRPRRRPRFSGPGSRCRSTGARCTRSGSAAGPIPTYASPRPASAEPWQPRRHRWRCGSSARGVARWSCPRPARIDPHARSVRSVCITGTPRPICPSRLAQIVQPPGEDRVQTLGADHLPGGPVQVLGVQYEGVALATAEPAVAPDQLLEGRYLVDLGPVGAVDQQVRAVGKARRPQQVVAGVRPVRRQRVLALNPIVFELVNAAGTERERPVTLRLGKHEADPGMATQSLDQAGVQLLDLLQADPPRQPRETDQAEAAGGHHRDLRLPVCGRAAPVPFPGRDHAPPGATVLRAALREPGLQVGERIVVSPALGQHRAGFGCPPNEFLE